MKKIISYLEKLTPYFDKFTANTYVSAMRDGLIAPMYVLLFSSIFMMIGYVPNTWGFYWSDEIMALLLKPYDFTMGLFGIIVTVTVSKALADLKNNDRPINKKLNPLAIMISSFSAFMILMADPIEGGITIDYLGSSGMLFGVVIAFIIPNIYAFCVDRNLTVRLPKEVPPNISETFASLIAYSLSISVFWIFDIVFRHFSGGINVSQAIMTLLNPIFVMADTYVGLSIINGAAAFFQFLGLNGPDVVLPAVKPAMFMNLAENQALYAQGLQPIKTLTNSAYDMTAAFGGTGATLVLVFMFAFLSKSKANKAVGKAAILPVMFAVNEPLTFGAPLVLNPLFFIPFMVAPIANTILYKFFVATLGMNAFIMEVPWTTPAPIGLPLGTNLHPLSFVLVLLIIVVDFAIYYPFFKVYEKQVLEQELLSLDNELDGHENKIDVASLAKDLSDKVNVLVLCAGGGTSGLFANTLNEVKVHHGIELNAQAGHYGQHNDILPNYDLVVLAPQVSSHYENLKKQASQYGAKVAMTTGKEYIAMTRDKELAADFVLAEMSKGD
ncbi:PTS transporter subunit EIIC [Erysipelothrix urinaevulpis]|uniref:PTS transporter subunit EIIC n=1 Tax=Erysipelothrix urinaevulpis TaxID=2683717 RepID=UPI0013573715|nr:PTS transporter subunit EIIC [Erysipelothrix urinaevulpis]